MRLNDATTVASKLLAALAPACERIEIAGSIRRRKADVKDIELVAIARTHTAPVYGVPAGDLFAPSPLAGEGGGEGGLPQPTRTVSDLVQAIHDLEEADAVHVIKPNTLEVIRWHVDDDAKYIRLHIPAVDLKVDLFVTTPESWGLILMIRTGAWDFSRDMLARWKHVSGGGYSLEGHLYRPAARNAEPTLEEADVFALCQVAYLEPPLRVDGHAVSLHAIEQAGARQ